MTHATMDHDIEQASDVNQFLTFVLGAEEYGLEILKVQEIKGHSGVTRMPNTPPHVKGVTNLRGSVLPVIDLRTRFALDVKDDTKQTRIMIVTLGTIKAGIIVDAVSEVLRVPDDSVEPLPPMINSVDSAFLKGIVRLENRLIIMLELSKVLNLDEQRTLESLTA